MTEDCEQPRDPIAGGNCRHLGQQDPNLLQTVLDSLTHPFYVVDVATRQLRLANRAAEELYAGRSGTCHAITHGRDTPCDSRDHPCPVRIIAETKKPVVVEHVHRDPQGRCQNVEVHGFPIFDDDGKVVQVIEYCIDVTEHKRTVEQHEWELAVNKALVELADALLRPITSIEEIADMVLAQAKQLTASEHGYVSSIDPETADLVSHTLTHMMGPLCRIPRDQQNIIFRCDPDGRYPGLWGHSLNSREGFYTDAPTQYTGSKGIPEGHVPLKNFMSVPALMGETVLGQIALANSERGYSDRELDAIKHMAKLYALAVRRTRVEHALKASEERYALAQKAAKVGSWDWNIATDTLVWSEHVGPIFGLANSQSSATLGDFLECVHPQDRQRVMDSVRACIERKQDYRLEHRIIWPSGDERWVLETGDVVRDAKGQAMRMLGVVQDITERKRAELQIRDLAKFAAENPSPVLRIRRDGGVLYSNRPGQVLMRAWKTQPGQRLPEEWNEHIQRVFRHNRTQIIDTVIEDRIFSLVLVPVTGADYVNIYGHDVTAQKAAEHQIRDLNRELENRVLERTAELTAVNTRLRGEFMQRKLLERELLGISEREQRRIGQELHDSLGQQLTGIAIMTKVLEQKLRTQCPAEAAEAKNIAQLVNQAIDETRQLSRGLHPITLDEDGLAVALQGLAARTDSVFHVACTFQCQEPVQLRDVTVAGHLYRIAQEAVTNAIRHAAPQAILIELSDHDGRITLKVSNDGTDFPEVLPENHGIGLQVMRYRAEMIDAALTIERGPIGGTRVACTFEKKTGAQDGETSHVVKDTGQKETT